MILYIERKLMNPVLFLLIRTDLDSMNPGKACAQAAHAANAVEKHYEAWTQEASAKPTWFCSAKPTPKTEEINRAWFQWKYQTTQGFGTTIVLGGSMSQIKVDIDHLTSAGFLAGVVHDPTYPLLDGKVTHLIPLDTCAYVFAPNKDDPALRAILDNYELHP